MTFKTFPCKFTCLIGIAFLGSFFWIAVSPGWTGFLVGLTLILCFLVSAAASLVKLINKESGTNGLRVLINILIFALLIPVVRFGHFVRMQIFLSELPRYQQLTDLLVKNEKAKSAVFGADFPLPQNYSDLSDLGFIPLNCDEHNVVTAWYFSAGSWALHHDGFLYRSDDDVSPLKKKGDRVSFIRLTPKWYFFAD